MKDEIKNEGDERRFNQRAANASFWIKTYAPEDFKFQINSERPNVELTSKQQLFVDKLSELLETSWDNIETDKELHEKMYEIIKAEDLSPAEAFGPLYKIIISKEKGPKLAGFIRTIGKERVLKLLK